MTFQTIQERINSKVKSELGAELLKAATKFRNDIGLEGYSKVNLKIGDCNHTVQLEHILTAIKATAMRQKLDYRLGVATGAYMGRIEKLEKEVDELRTKEALRTKNLPGGL